MRTVLKNVLMAGLISCSVAVNAQLDSNVTLLYHWEDTSLAGSGTYNNTYNEIWGFVQGGREYAVIGSTDGSHIFDVTDPKNSTMVDFVAGASMGPHIIHRDYHDYKGYLYMVSDEGQSTLQIADLSYLPDSVHIVYDSPDLIKRAHNIFIDTATARLYSLSTRNPTDGYNGMQIFSIVNPVSPELILTFDDLGTIHDAYIENNIAYLHNGNKGMYIYDFTDTAQPAMLGLLEFYPHKGYNHSGWLSPDGKHFVLADENHGKHLKMLDVSDPSDIQIVTTFTSAVDTSSMAHNVIIEGDYAHVSYYHDGYQVFDISDPANPVKRGFYRTYTNGDHESYRGCWGVYPYLPSGTVLASDMQNGLFVFDISKAVGVTVKTTSSNQNFNIFPNPYNDNFTILMPSGSNGNTKTIYIHSSEGKLVFKASDSGRLFKINKILPQGIYIVSVEMDGFISHKRLVKVR